MKRLNILSFLAGTCILWIACSSSSYASTLIENHWAIMNPQIIETGLMLFLDDSTSSPGQPSSKPKPQLRIEEVHVPQIKTNDPALQGSRQPASLRVVTPIDSQAEGAFELMDETHWEYVPDFELAPRQSHVIKLEIITPVLMRTRAMWQGSPDSVDLLLENSGGMLARGKAYGLPPDGGVATIRMEIPETDTVSVRVNNRSDQTVTIRLVVGTWPLTFFEHSP